MANEHPNLAPFSEVLIAKWERPLLLRFHRSHSSRK